MRLFAKLVSIPLAAVALMFACGACLSMINLDDRFDGASSEGEPKSWPASASPRVVVDASDGAITVKPSLDGRITAVVTRNSLCKNLSEEAANDALRYIRVNMTEDDGAIKIATRPTEDMPKNDYARTGHYTEVSTTVEIRIPDGARLDLRTGTGSIWVVGRPAEIRAKNSCGIVAFELGPIRGPDGRSAVLKLEGFHGEAAVDADGEGYRYQGIVEPKP